MRINKKFKNILLSIEKILTPFFYIIISVSFLIGMVETVLYPGFFLKHFQINTRIIYFITFILGTLLTIFNLILKRSKRIFDEKMGFVMSIVFGCLFIFFYSLDILFFDNFVFSTFHIHPNQLFILFLLSTTFFIVSFNVPKKQNLFLIKLKSLFVYLWLTSIAATLVEAFTYRGFINKHYLINSYIFVYLALFLGIYLMFSFGKKNNLVNSNIYRLNTVFFKMIFTSYLLLSLLDLLNYKNFVFSKFHIFPENLFIVCLLSLFVILSKNISFNKNSKKREIWMFVFYIISAWALYINMTKINSMFIDQIRFMVRNPRASYDEKMRRMLSEEFYDYILFIKTNTPDNSTILIPPQTNPWPQSGNVSYVRYFLYPRKIAQGKQFEAADYNKIGIDYALLDWGEIEEESVGFTHGWPKFDIPSEEIILMRDNNEVEILKENYIFKNFKDKKLWGLIKIKKQ